MYYKRADEQVTLLEASDDNHPSNHKRQGTPLTTVSLPSRQQNHTAETLASCNDIPYKKESNSCTDAAPTSALHVSGTSVDRTGPTNVTTVLPLSHVSHTSALTVPLDISLTDAANPSHIQTRREGVKYKMVCKGKRLFIIVSTVVLALLAAIVIAVLLVHFTGSSRSKESPGTLKAYGSGAIDGRLSIIGGPMANYHEDLANKRSRRYQIFVHIFQTQMDLLYSRSRIQSFYNCTIVTSLRKGSIVVRFQIHLKDSIVMDTGLHRSLREILVNEIGTNRVFGSFIVDPTSVTISQHDARLPSLSSTDATIETGSCIEITMEKCINITDYRLTQYPNLLGHRNQQEATQAAKKFEPLWTSECYGYDLEFWCSIWTPQCYNETALPPCRKYCLDVYEACIEDIRSQNGTWPLTCSSLPDSNDPTVCRKNPYIPGQPQQLDVKLCSDVGYNNTVFPNMVGQISRRHALNMVKMLKSIQFDTHCYPHSILFACSVYFPRFSGNATIPYHITPPCRSLCQGCGGSNFSCDSTRCLPRSFICDGYRDCQDGTDEDSCASCPSGFTKCPPPSGLCVPTSYICDGFVNCYGALDEHSCVRIQSEVTGDQVGALQVYDPISDGWQAVCTHQWNQSFSDLVCWQLGYEEVVSVEHRPSVSRTTSILDFVRVANISSQYIQTYLTHSLGCPSGKVVHIRCGKAVCGLRPRFVPSPMRIVGGRQVRPGSWPWVVSLHGGPQESFFCMAFIITENWVVTAAHCVGGRTSVDGWLMQLGHTRRLAYAKDRITRTLKRIIVHENFTQLTVDNDIALLELATPLQFNDFVRPVCLPEPGVKVPLGSRCIVAGWGRKGFSEYNYQSTLEQVELSVVERESCAMALNNHNMKPPYKLTENMFCAGGALDHDACSGDSGGPFVCRMNGSNDRWYVGGIVSWGLKCATPYVPGVYTNIANYIYWIYKTISQYS